MTFPKAYSGVRKIFVSELLQILGGFLAALTAIFAVTGFTPLVAAGGAIGIAALVLEVVAFILQMVGLAQGGKDADQFMIAFWIIVISIVLNILIPILNQYVPNLGVVISVLEAVAGAASVFAILYTIFGVVNLANKLGDNDMAYNGRRLAWLVVILYATGVVIKLIPSFIPDPTKVVTTVIGVIAIVAAVIEVICYVLTLIYLGRAVKMLKK